MPKVDYSSAFQYLPFSTLTTLGIQKYIPIPSWKAALFRKCSQCNSIITFSEIILYISTVVAYLGWLDKAYGDYQLVYAINAEEHTVLKKLHSRRVFLGTIISF